MNCCNNEECVADVTFSATFFQNTACEYFPCHEGVPPERFNCMLCYCPLYTLGPHCGGHFNYNEEGRKDCSNCTLPHRGEAGIKMVWAKYDLLSEMASKKLE